MDELKRCSRCRTRKPRTDFHNNKGAKDGLNKECKECVRAKAAARRSDPEKNAIDLARARKRAANPEVKAHKAEVARARKKACPLPLVYREPLQEKRCYKCGEAKAPGEFYKSKHRGDGLTPECKECVKAMAKQRRSKPGARINDFNRHREYVARVGVRERLNARRREILATRRSPVTPKTTKVCHQCKRELALESFYSCKTRPGGLTAACKDCNKSNAASRRLDDAKREKDAQRQREYNQRPEVKMRNVVFSHKRRVRIANAGSHTAAEWMALCEKYNWTCLKCGRSDVPMTVDHVVPLAKGGTNDIGNIQCLCGSCNSRKSTKTIDYRPSS